MRIPHYTPLFFVIILGALDCITTLIGTQIFGAHELNPLLSGVVANTPNLFVIIKLGATIGVASIFAVADRMTTYGYGSQSVWSKRIVEGGYVGIIIFLAITVMNNFITIAYGFQYSQ